jgi:hypothetical protein
MTAQGRTWRQASPGSLRPHGYGDALGTHSAIWHPADRGPGYPGPWQRNGKKSTVRGRPIGTFRHDLSGLARTQVSGAIADACR